MFMPGIMAPFSQIVSILSTIFMIWMLVDCVRNQSLRSKGGWIVFILFTQLIGATVYFFARGPWSKVKLYLFSRNSFPVYQAPRAPQPAQERFSAYEQGYQAQEPVQGATLHEDPHIPEALPSQPEYEQPLVNYPEMPPMQQQ